MINKVDTLKIFLQNRVTIKKMRNNFIDDLDSHRKRNVNINARECAGAMIYNGPQYIQICKKRKRMNMKMIKKENILIPSYQYTLELNLFSNSLYLRNWNFDGI
jgi:hypothetical protein